MMWPTVCHIHKPHGIVNRGPRCFTKREDGALHGMATRMHPGAGGEDPGAAQGAAPGHRVIGIGVNTPAASHPTCPQGATVGNPYP